ncbi:hypothetical protein PPTG_22122 [Phytophthora nicotianae INRA-310]|uniref:RxLR effector protein n=2 Tax=Phytophthora nicotianae TaxID=4792 RepID=W2QQA7_PHYN3|nr:hypothetical protein PPTG_22122 [Phytophthora nicotianae INRA-310]ETN14435.1 hypothetical protein PPTG_22122 [Phytophthora nicotianae INRA-310]KUF85176.1 hypothetical protein AM587_10003733 [Phytophthora nicotianae]
MHWIRLVLIVAVSVVAVSNEISANANEVTETTTTKSTLMHDAVPSLHEATRELSDDDAALEERRGGGGGGGGGGQGVGGGAGHITTGGIEGGDSTTTTGGGGISRPNTSIGLMNTNGVTSHKEKKCNRFFNWWRRLFDKSIPKCPKKTKEDKRRLRV